ncbi:MAG: 3-hydroxyacyl-CoA dehydrogenase/enoyl-CoA hydratase family protein [Sphingobacteriales bacterium]|nr:3-hydroxyacyl-CoA dehydrogenase/enoyl-CoA hydratase family protein [Sphingobacteriales bacterium]
MKQIKTVGVVGAGTMGSALAQKFAQEGFKVILADQAINFVEKGLTSIHKTLEDGVEKKVFTKTQADEYLSNLKGTDSLADLKDCDLVAEAIFENLQAKKDLFRLLGEIVSNDCIVATNTSSFSVTELAASIVHPERVIGLHFFYHAAKNRLVEIIPGKKTSSETLKTARLFSVLAGKDAIDCTDTYGFTVNRFFVPWLNESVKLLQEGVATKSEIDFVCMKVFGIGMGPFALMNATGVPIAYHSEKTLEVFGKLYEVAEALKSQAESGRPWEIELQVEAIDPAKEKIISDRMQGVVFFVCSQILEEKVSSATHLNRGAKIGLRWKNGPVDLMKNAGEEKVNRLVAMIAGLYNMKVPSTIGGKYWQIESVKLEKNNSVAILTMDQPENMNALSEKTVQELSEKFNEADSDPGIETIFITGSGKAFVAGADIKFFVKNIKAGKINDIETFTAFGQDVFNRIDQSKKKVVAINNGLTLGGGLELALCADMILALPKAQFAFPETGIGIYPGLGGTQRSVRKIGKGLSKYLIHTGKMLSAKESEEIGLVDKIISAEEVIEMIEGRQNIPVVAEKALPEKWQKVKDLFEKNSLVEILENRYSNRSMAAEEAEKIVKTIGYKAPVAIRLADKLIEEERGSDSELAYLSEIFSTSDALLGLTSIGKKVQYEGK